MRRTATASRPSAAARGSLCLLVAGWLAMLHGTAPLAWAQYKADPKEPTPGVAAPAAGEEAADESANGLPAGFEPPGEAHPSMFIENELMTPAEVAEVRNNKEFARLYKEYMNNGDMSPAAADVIKRGIEVSIKEMSLLENRERLDKLRAGLDKELAYAAYHESNSLKKEQFRAFVLGEVTRHAAELLNNQLQVRIQAAFLLAGLTLLENDPRANLPERPYTPVFRPLLAAVEDPTQAVSVKIAALRGLKRILANGDLKTPDRQMIADSLIAQLEDPGVIWWYQRLVVEALGWTDVLAENNQLPVIVQRLTQIMVDPTRAWQVRSAAAKALGRVKLNAQIKVDLLAYHVAHLCRQMCDAYNSDRGAAYWKGCFMDLYLAFKPADRFEEARQAGLISKLTSAGISQYGTTVRGAYQHVLPIVKYMIDSQRAIELPGEVIDPLQVWLDENTPADLRIHPGLDPISWVSEELADQRSNAG